ncbi:transmembrane protein, putative [Medicago truncatula]|uniref:Transmembrane protein, putative n=1 Tax=Medicago truncatula TaxID=3880 RepID=A0A072UU04_MEDTR|nr:transmembrane protein, putative [Medicago truncatula]
MAIDIIALFTSLVIGCVIVKPIQMDHWRVFNCKMHLDVVFFLQKHVKSPHD